MKAPPEAPRIFTGQILSEGAVVELEEGPARHVAGALRLKQGQPLRLFNGRGGEYMGYISSADRRGVSVTVGEYSPLDRESPLAVTLGLGVSRGERMDYAIQKCTELGVRRIVPLLTERTEVRLKGERAQRKHRHWEQVAISACEQCGRNLLPEITRITPLQDWLGEPGADCRLVLHHRAERSLAELPSAAAVALLIGPEGGLAEGEIDAARSAGFDAIALGPRILRTETAPAAALAILQFHWGDMR